MKDVRKASEEIIELARRLRAIGMDLGGGAPTSTLGDWHGEHDMAEHAVFVAESVAQKAMLVLFRMGPKPTA